MRCSLEPSVSGHAPDDLFDSATQGGADHGHD